MFELGFGYLDLILIIRRTGNERKFRGVRSMRSLKHEKLEM